MCEQVSRAVARVLRYEDVNKIWNTQKELSTRFKDVWRLQNVDEGVRDVVQEGEGLVNRKRFVVKDQNDIYSCVAARGKEGVAKRQSG